MAKLEEISVSFSGHGRFAQASKLCISLLLGTLPLACDSGKFATSPPVAVPPPAATSAAEGVPLDPTPSTGQGFTTPGIVVSTPNLGAGEIVALSPVSPAAVEEILQTGVPVQRVGINFEDLPSGDNDFNDAVLCFTGAFRLDGTKVVSLKEQSVSITTSSVSACIHEVTVTVFDKAGAMSYAPVTFNSRHPIPINLQYKLGSVMDVSMKVVGGICPAFERTMHKAADCKVLPDVCNTSGG